jgi:hypothetical protein
MEFFLPGLLLFFVAIIVTILIVPTITPMVAAILSILFLTYGVYDHYRMFASEYRLSTWQDGVKIYAPFIMIAGIILYVIYFIFVFFTKGEVPIPKVEAPSINTSATLNSIKNTTTNTLNKISNGASNLFSFNSNSSNNTNKKTNTNEKKTPNNGMSRSLFETI